VSKFVVSSLWLKIGAQHRPYNKLGHGPLFRELAFPGIKEHNGNMTADTLTVPLATDCVGHLEKRLTRELGAAAEEWSECASALTLWEDEHLLDSPAEDLLARHQATVERLLQFGKLLSSVVESPDFPDKQLAAMVSATQQMLQDKLVMWHGTISQQRRKATLLSPICHLAAVAP
jgi:hypothetical protein